MFKKGDRVRFLDEPGEGIVQAIEGNRVLVEDENGFTDQHAVNTLLMVQEMPFSPELKAPVKDQELSKPRSGRPSKSRPNFLECDLHFGQLVEFPKNFSNHQKLQIQLRETEKALAKAKRAGIKRVILIHGVGQGRLKEEVHTLLERKDGLTFYDASYAEYGRGATEVQFF